MSALSPNQMFVLDSACKPIFAAFGECPYLVGTAAQGKEYRDVDIRLILDDEKYDQMEKAIGRSAIVLMGFVLSQYLNQITGLPIDFQFQHQSTANEKHDGQRNALGIRDISDYRGDAIPSKAKDN